MKLPYTQQLLAAAFAIGLIASPLAFAHADVSASIQSLSPSTNILAGTQLNFLVSASGFVSPTYGITDSFSGSSISTSNIDTNGNFSWTPSTTDVGTHLFTISITDSSGNTTSVQQQITVAPALSVTITNLSNSGTAVVGVPLTLTLSPAGFTSPAYSLNDSFTGNSTLFSSDIDGSGNFSWTPSTGDIGTRTITFYATDSQGHVASVALPVTVAATANPVPVVATGSSLSSAQIGAILSLIQSFGADQSTINSVAAALGGQPIVATPAPATPGYVFVSYLHPGITSDEVSALQTVLTQKGFFSGPVTGYYGSITEDAVIAFQAAHGIDQLGVVGPATRAALNAQ